MWARCEWSCSGPGVHRVQIPQHGSASFVFRLRDCWLCLNEIKARPEVVYKHGHSGGGLGLTTRQAEVRSLSPKEQGPRLRSQLCASCLSTHARMAAGSSGTFHRAALRSCP
ncbi:hypothetical protein AV530_009534 [Patagioenas fasciata monilis]|uniref:Uncharacterized protein n=1 Tax=Patagioenas fasciata monilis TaxID=372326 RepID=A0A1V4JKN9_PATFA|nr:hypothetical protein AV530_009534 [Patagioenas fasciata monilis]